MRSTMLCTNSTIEQFFSTRDGNSSTVRIMFRGKMFIKLFAIFVIVQSVSCQWKPNNPGREALCNTLECEARGEEYKLNMNIDANPCQDFYTFACGNWHNNHSGPKYAPIWNVLDLMEFDFAQIIQKILESYNFQPGDDNMFRRVKEVYETCMKIRNIAILVSAEYPMNDAKNISKEIMKVGRFPTIPLWNIHFHYLKLSGESPLFLSKVLAGSATEGIPVLIIMEPHSAYGSIFHEDVWKPQEQQAYSNFLFRIIKSLELKDSDALIKERIRKVFNFRKKLNWIIQLNKKKKPDSYNPMTGVQLDKWFSNAVPDQTKTQKIYWKEVIEVLLVHLPPETRQTQKVIAMRQKQYFLDLMDLLKNVSEEVLADHIEIDFIENHLKLDKSLYKLLEATSVEPHQHLRYIREKYDPRWQTCIKNLNMEETLEELVFKEWFFKNNTEIARQINDKVKKAIEKRMRNSKWLDQPTCQETVKKLKNLNEWFGFPPWLNGDGTPLERNPKDILIAEASLTINTNFNLLYIRAPLFLPPIFSRTIPMVYNYAGIGTTLGHEMYHIIDDCGCFEEENRNVVWWSPRMRNRCLRKKSRFIDVYNKITDKEFKNRYNIDVKSNTSATFLENFPDVMGLKAAYDAYKELASKEKSVCQTLPHFEEYSCDQMFYIAFANTYCGYYTRKSAETKLLKKSMHSIDCIRVNAAVAQMDNFGSVFGCPVESPMNPEQKLDLWQ